MKRPFPEALFCYYNNYRDKSVKLHDIGPDHMKKLKVLVDYGLDIDDGSKRLSSCEDAAKKIVGRKGQVPEVNYNNAEISLAMMSDIDRHGAEALSRWKNPQQYYAEYKEKREKESAERQRQQEIAQERLKAKKQAVSSYIASRPDLSKALNEVVKIGAEREAVYSFISKNGFGRLCETGRNNTFYQSKTCLSEWKVVRRQASSHYSSLDSAYKKQRDWFAGLFGQNASVAAAVVDDRAARTPSDKTVKQQYAPIEQQLIRITESEARSERAESRRREQQQMADFMNHIQTTFERTNRMLDRNMAQTHRVVNQAYASQRVRDVSTGSGYRVHRAPAMRDLNKELEEIDRSFDVSASERSGEKDSRQVAAGGAASSSNAGKKECVARSESTGPKPNVPKRYCQYVFADYTDNASFSLEDYGNEFMEESHSEESAKETLAFELLQQAKKQCKSKGYSRVHHNETYEFNEVAVTVGQCKENNRLGSTFYICGGTASFICAR